MSYWNFYLTTTHVARKDYPCEACQLVRDTAEDFYGLTFSEKRAVVKAKRNNFKIKKGEKYMKVTGKFDGEWATFRAIPAIDAICRKYDLYVD